jgi:nucleoid DNA-binding protein
MGHIDNFKKWGNKAAKAVEEQAIADQTPAAVDPIAEKPMTDAIETFNKQIQALTAQKNLKIQELNKFRVEAAKKKANMPPAPAAVPPTQIPPTV